MKNVFGFLATVLLFISVQGVAEENITRQQIQQVLDATDLATKNRDAEAIGVYLGSKFFKYIDLPSKDTPLAVELTKKQFLEQIAEGWKQVDDYSYQRKDVVINVAKDKQSAESFSTIIENFSVKGQKMVSKVREYATYELEDGRPVIVQIESHTLVGDTTPE
jgi:hypothetical protein